MSDLEPTATEVVFVSPDGEPFTTSLVIATETGNDHASAMRLVRDNLSDLNEVGRVGFEIRPFETAGGMQRREVAVLNESAAALLMTYLRNTEKVKDFKKRLVGGFFEMRRMLTAPAALPVGVEDRAMKRLALLQAAKGLIDDRHLEAKARCQLAIGLGEAPELDPQTRPLYAQTYLEEKGLNRRQVKSLAGMFGKRMKAAYREMHGRFPMQYPMETSNGQVRDVNAYTELDRPLMDAVWTQFYAQGELA